MGVSSLQLVNLHRNQRYFVIKLHTWFCLEDKHKQLLHLSIFYEYQHFFQHRICFLVTNQTSHVTTYATYSDPWPTLARSTSLFLICCYKNPHTHQQTMDDPITLAVYFFYIKLKIMSEVVLLLPNTDHFQQNEDYVKGCTTSTKYWLLSTSWRLCQRLYYFYQILTAFNKMKIMSKVVLLLPNTDRLQQVEDYVKGCTTSTKYWPLSTKWRLCQRLYYFYQILTAFNKMKIMSKVVLLLPNTDRFQQNEDYVKGCTTSTKYWLLSTSWRLCQRLYYFYQILTAFNKMKIMSKVVLLLPNTDRFQQVEDYVSVWLYRKYRLGWKWSVFGRSGTTSDIIFNLLKAVSILVRSSTTFDIIFNLLKVVSIW